MATKKPAVESAAPASDKKKALETAQKNLDNCNAVAPIDGTIIGLAIQAGQEIEARVSRVHEDGKLDLSVRKKAFLQMDEDAQKILEKMEELGGALPFTDKAAPEQIKEELGLSKNAFKRAVGRLLKEQKIQITEKAIEFLEK